MPPFATALETMIMNDEARPSNNTHRAQPGSLTVFETAQIRWLNVEEIMKLLSPENLYQSLLTSTSPPSSPPTSGTLLLYDRSNVRNYKSDGHEWIKKRSNPNKVREDHVKLRHKGQYRVSGTYVHSATVSTTHRRVYRLIPDQKSPSLAEESAKDMVLVHYLDTDEATHASEMYAEHISAGTRSSMRHKNKRRKIGDDSAFQQPEASCRDERDEHGDHVDCAALFGGPPRSISTVGGHRVHEKESIVDDLDTLWDLFYKEGEDLCFPDIKFEEVDLKKNAQGTAVVNAASLTKQPIVPRSTSVADPRTAAARLA